MNERPIDFQRVDITSTSNRWIRFARSLHRRRQRYRERAILIEGVRPVREALNADLDITVVLLSSEVDQGSDVAEVARRFLDRGVPVLRVDTAALDAAADTETPQGIIAIASMPELPLKIPEGISPLYLIADRIRDPGNLGTLIRSSLGAGVHAIYIAPESTDPFSPKVVRASMGGIFRIPVRNLDWNQPPDELASCEIYAADSGASRHYSAVNWKHPSAVIVGNETMGLSPEASRMATARVGIPLASELESLNAAIAGSVILFEAARHRREG